MNFSEHVYYDESSPSFLKRKHAWLSGKNYCVVRAPAGSNIGHECQAYGYYLVCIKSKNYRASRVVWELFNGPIEEGMQIDHIDGNRANNKISNLRCVSSRTNGQNKRLLDENKSGVNGVCYTLKTTKEKDYYYWTATWRGIDSKRNMANFSVEKLGYDEAFRLACKCREDAIIYLNSNGQITQRTTEFVWRR